MATENIPSFQNTYAGSTSPLVDTFQRGQTAPYASSAKKFGDLDYLKSQAEKGDAWALDKYYNYYLSEMSANSARKWTAEREDTAYQRLKQDLIKAGLNPAILAQTNAGPITSASSGNNYQGSTATSAYKTDQDNSMKWKIADMNAAVKVAVAGMNNITGIMTTFINGISRFGTGLVHGALYGLTKK